MLLNDLADRIHASRGLNVAVNYGFNRGVTIPMVVGADQPFALPAVRRDDANFMSIPSRVNGIVCCPPIPMTLGWSVASVWSASARSSIPKRKSINLVSQLADLYQGLRWRR